MSKVTVNFGEITGKIKDMNSVGQPPFTGVSSSWFNYLKEANIRYSRLHDVQTYGSLYVDVHNIFRDFDKDENDENNYDFVFTDWLIEELVKNDCMPVYRLGASIENYHYMKSYHIFPPKDYEKWARICEHIIAHYIDGWANGFKFDIKYWEIWNEPDNGEDIPANPMWKGTYEEFYELYAVAAIHLKKVFGDKIKIGGYGCTGFSAILGEQRYLDDIKWVKRLEFFNDFFAHIKKRNAPLDFFSWHSYLRIEKTVRMEKYVEEQLREKGYGDAEIMLNEWNNSGRVSPRGSSFSSASAAAMMIAMQKTKAVMLNFYDARMGASVYGGLFNPLTFEPLSTYYSFKAFGELLALSKETKCESDSEEIYALSATNGKENAVLIANMGKDTELETNLENKKVFLIDENNFLTETSFNSSKFTLKEFQTVLIK